MTITNTVASKLFVGFVAIAFALSLVAPAQAATEEELQAQIDQLMATINGLQSQLGEAPATTGGSSASVCPYAWTRSLSTGATGADVMALQKFLNADANTMVAATGVGSAGMETDYFGGLTAAAVSNFQVMYRDEILTPVGLVNPTGYFGPSTMAKANALCASAPVVVDDTMDDDADDTSDDTMDDVADLQGEGTLANFDVDDDEDEVMEGDEDVVVAVLTMEAEDGDILLDRITFTLTDPTTVGLDENDEGDPWDVFDEVSLWVDGDKIADFEADDEDNYLDEDAGEFRFSKVNLILPEDDEVEVLVAVSVANSVDGSDDTVNDAADWAISPTEVRYFDADNVATTEDTFDGLGDSVTFDVVEEGVDDGADINSNSDNPDAVNLEVDDETDESEEYVVHIFDIEVDRDSSDLTLDDAFVDVYVSNPTGAADTTMDDVIDSIFVTIDGETVEGEATDILGSDDGDADETEDGEIDHVIAATENNTVRFRFEFDGLDLEGDTDYEVEVSIVFEGQDDGSNYENGVQVYTDVTGSTWEVEGLADDNLLGGSDTGETHSLFASGITVDVDSAATEITTGDTAGDDTVDFVWELSITAFGEEDVYITSDFANIVAALAGADDVEIEYELEQTGGAAVSVTGGTITSAADEVTGDTGAYGGDYSGEGFFRIVAGDTEEFTITVSAENATDSKQVQAWLNFIEWTTDEVDDASGDSDLLTGDIQSYSTDLADDTETGFKTIN